MPVPGLALKMCCAICHTILFHKVADWMDEVVDSKKTLGDSGSTWWNRSAKSMSLKLSSYTM